MFSAQSGITAWREALTGLLGHDPADRPGLPLLVRLTTAARPARGPHAGAARLSPAAVHDLVIRTAHRAGHTPGRYGSHSLRSGWITEAAGTEGVTAFDIQQVSGHQLLESVLRYVRPVNARRRNPNRLMGGGHRPPNGE